MKLKVFTLRWCADTGGFDDDPLQKFLATRQVVSISEHFFVHENTPTLVLVLSYRESENRTEIRRMGAPATHGARQDAAAELNDVERKRFEILRNWRNGFARKMGRPPYAVLTNRQLAEFSKRVPTCLQDLRAVSGIGDARVQSFGEELILLTRKLDEEMRAGPQPAPPAMDHVADV